MKRSIRDPRPTGKGSLHQLFCGEALTELIQPVLHINCRGSIEVENCSRVLEYTPQRIRLQLSERTVTVEGDALVILSLNRYVTQIRGDIYRLTFSQEDGT